MILFLEKKKGYLLFYESNYLILDLYFQEATEKKFKSSNYK